MILLVLFGVALIITVVFACQLFVALNRYRLKGDYHQPLPQNDMPTVSVCIPARNETHALAECLNSVLQSDYEKLEVIVYDDCSQDKTSRIIKSFAQDGVRFVQGDAPAEGWLGKNYACEILAQQANGDYLIYMGVDTRVESHTISELVNYTLVKHVSMVSVLPRRRDSGWRASVIFSPLRYFIQMIIPQWIHTPAATALWLVHRDKLRESGGFGVARNQIMPESTFAGIFDKRGTYRYIIGTDKLGVFYEKRWQSQIDTSIRLSYPTLKKQPLLVFFVVAVIYSIFIAPYIITVTAFMTGVWDTAALCAVSLTVLFAFLYMMYTRRVWRHGWLAGALVLPYLLLQELAVILTSMFAYMFGKVDWKGRNICYPVLKRIK